MGECFGTGEIAVESSHSSLDDLRSDEQVRDARLLASLGKFCAMSVRLIGHSRHEFGFGETVQSHHPGKPENARQRRPAGQGRQRQRRRLVTERSVHGHEWSGSQRCTCRPLV